MYGKRFIATAVKNGRWNVIIPFMFTVSFIIVLAVSFYANSLVSFSMHIMEYNIEQRLMTASQWLADIVSAEELDNYRTVEDMELPEYKVLRERLLEFSQKTNVLYVYYLRFFGDEWRYIVDNDYNEETRVGLDISPGQKKRWQGMSSLPVWATIPSDGTALSPRTRPCLTAAGTWR